MPPRKKINLQRVLNMKMGKARKKNGSTGDTSEIGHQANSDVMQIYIGN